MISRASERYCWASVRGVGDGVSVDVGTGVGVDVAVNATGGTVGDTLHAHRMNTQPHKITYFIVTFPPNRNKWSLVPVPFRTPRACSGPQSRRTDWQSVPLRQAGFVLPFHLP